MSVVIADLDPEVRAFLDSMPLGYRDVFNGKAFQEHAKIVAQRAGERGYAAVWKTLPRGLAVVCVVADDAPGLLSIVSTVLVLHRLDVVAAQLFCRKTAEGKSEAVDFFWVRHPDRSPRLPPSEGHLERCTRTISGFLKAGIDPDAVASGPISIRPSAARCNVSCQPSSEGGPGGTSLLIEASDGPGLLMCIAKALHDSQVSVVASEIKTDGKLAKDRFELTGRDGRALNEADRSRVHATVQNAIIAWHNASAVQNAS